MPISIDFINNEIHSDFVTNQDHQTDIRFPDRSGAELFKFIPYTAEKLLFYHVILEELREMGYSKCELPTNITTSEPPTIFMKSPIIRLTRLLFSTLALGMVLTSPINAADVVWKSDFSALPVGPLEGFGTESSIGEEGGLRFLSHKSAEQQVLFREASDGIPDLINYRSTVRFRYHDDCSMIIAVKNRGGGRDEAQYLWYYIGVTKNTIQVSTQHLDLGDRQTYLGDPRVISSVDLGTAGVITLSSGEWITFSADVGEKVLKVRLTLDSGETGEWEFPVFAGLGGSYLVARMPADISEFVVEQLPEPVLPAE